VDLARSRLCDVVFFFGRPLGATKETKNGEHNTGDKERRDYSDR
jgi:hypothetical protein